MKTAVTKRTDTIKNQHNKQEMEKTIFQGKNVQKNKKGEWAGGQAMACLLYTSPSPRDA